MRHTLLVVAALSAVPAPATAQDAAESGAVGPVAVVETALGSFEIQLLPELAPKHVEHFTAAAEAGDYAGTTFHRIIPGGIIQGGDPLSKDPGATDRYGTGGLGLLPAEFSERPMTRGSVAAVLLPGRPDSGGYQFFVCLFDQLALTGQYTIFGEIAGGMDVVDAIGRTPVEGDRALERVEIVSVTLKGEGDR